MCYFSSSVEADGEITQILGIGVRLNNINLLTALLRHLRWIETLRYFNIWRFATIQKSVGVTADHEIDILDFLGDPLIGLEARMTQSDEDVDTLLFQLFGFALNRLHFVLEDHLFRSRQDLRFRCEITDYTDFVAANFENRTVFQVRGGQVRLLGEIEIRRQDRIRGVLYKGYQTFDAIVEFVVAQGLLKFNRK